MRILEERPQIKDIAPAPRTGQIRIAPVTPVKVGENASHRTSGAVLRVGKWALLKIASGVTVMGRIVAGPPMSDRDRFRYAANVCEIQKYSGISASWPQNVSR